MFVRRGSLFPPTLSVMRLVSMPATPSISCLLVLVVISLPSHRWLESMSELRSLAHSCFLELTTNSGPYPMEVHISDEFMDEGWTSVISQQYDPRLHLDTSLQDHPADWEEEHRPDDTALLINGWKGATYVDSPYIEWAARDGAWGIKSQNGTVVIWGPLVELLNAKQPLAFVESYGEPNSDYWHKCWLVSCPEAAC